MLGSTFLFGQIVFLGWFHETVGLFAKGFLMFLFITLAAVRLGTHGTTAVLAMVVQCKGLLAQLPAPGILQMILAKPN